MSDRARRTLARAAAAGDQQAGRRLLRQLCREHDPALLAAAQLRDQLRRWLFSALDAGQLGRRCVRFSALVACLEQGLATPLTPTATFAFVVLAGSRSDMGGVGMYVACLDDERVQVGIQQGTAGGKTLASYWPDWVKSWSGAPATRERKLREDLAEAPHVVDVPRSTVEDLLRFESWSQPDDYDVWALLHPTPVARDGRTPPSKSALRKLERAQRAAGWSDERLGDLCWELGGQPEPSALSKGEVAAATKELELALDRDAEVPAELLERLEATRRRVGFSEAELLCFVAERAGTVDLRALTPKGFQRLVSDLSEAGGGGRLVRPAALSRMKGLLVEHPKLLRRVHRELLGKALPKEAKLGDMSARVVDQLTYAVELWLDNEDPNASLESFLAERREIMQEILAEEEAEAQRLLARRQEEQTQQAQAKAAKSKAKAAKSKAKAAKSKAKAAKSKAKAAKGEAKAAKGTAKAKGTAAAKGKAKAAQGGTSGSSAIEVVDGELSLPWDETRTWTPGPRALELDEVCAKARRLQVDLVADYPPGKPVVGRLISERSYSFTKTRWEWEQRRGPEVAKGWAHDGNWDAYRPFSACAFHLLWLLRRGQIDLEALKLKSSDSPLKGKALKTLVVAACQELREAAQEPAPTSLVDTLGRLPASERTALRGAIEHGPNLEEVGAALGLEDWKVREQLERASTRLGVAAQQLGLEQGRPAACAPSAWLLRSVGGVYDDYDVEAHINGCATCHERREALLAALG